MIKSLIKISSVLSICFYDLVMLLKWGGSFTYLQKLIFYPVYGFFPLSQRYLFVSDRSASFWEIHMMTEISENKFNFFFLSRNITNFNPCRGLKLIIFLSIFSHRLLKEEQVQLSFSFWLPSCSEQLLLPQGTIPRARDLQTMENL